MTKLVLIVGAGPVGMTMASELARYGVAVRIVDKAAERTDKSKALVLWSRTLELLDRGGGSAPFVEAGFKAVAVNFITGDKVVGRVATDSVRSPYPYGLMLPQSDTERLLEERLGTQGVKVERRVELVTFMQRDDGVEAVLRHAGTKKPCRRRGSSAATARTASSATRSVRRLPAKPWTVTGSSPTSI